MEYFLISYNLIKNCKEFLCPRGCDYPLFTTTDLFNKISQLPPPVSKPCPWYSFGHHASLFGIGTRGPEAQHAGRLSEGFIKSWLWGLRLGTGENLKPWPRLYENHPSQSLVLSGTAVAQLCRFTNYKNIQEYSRFLQILTHFLSLGMIAFLKDDMMLTLPPGFPTLWGCEETDVLLPAAGNRGTGNPLW